MSFTTPIAGKRILWVDDEIDLLKPHIILLEQRGYNVATATNGEDAIELTSSFKPDLVFLDESMIGMSGLETLTILKEIDPGLPVVMVTKNEAESLMEQAIGQKISDYLTKPVNPTQILAACKKFLEAQRISEQHVTERYLLGFNEITRRMFDRLEWSDWLDIYLKMTHWSLELDQHPEHGFTQTLRDQWRECNSRWSDFVEDNYRDWLTDKREDGNPLLSPHIMDSHVIPKLSNGKPTVFFVIDCMRLDQWLVMEELLRPYYTVSKEYYCGMLPTATPYARNAIFAGLYPADIKKHYPTLWTDGRNDDHSQNAHEKELVTALLARRNVRLKQDLNYIKIIDTDFGRKIENEILRFAKNQFTAIVVNAVDMIAHSRSDYPILREIAPDESAYRTLTRSWFTHSSFFGMLKTLSTVKDLNIVITTDHGSVRCLHGAKAVGDRDTSTNLRYKVGRNVRSEDKHSWAISSPELLRIPKDSTISNVIIAKEDYYFVYPTDYHHFLSKYRDSFQHGGISMEEMILPVISLESR